MAHNIQSIYNQYFDFVGDTESPLIYHRWCFIGTVAAALARNVHLSFGHKRLYPNLYLMLIGDPGARKSTAIEISKDLLSATGFKHFSSSRTSAEKFIADLEESSLENLSEFSQAFIAADEFSDFIGAQNYSFISLLTKLFDSPEVYSHRLKNSKSVNLVAPTVNILGGNTHAGFALSFPPEIIHTGLLSRLLLVYSEKKKTRITWPTPGADKARKAMYEFIGDLRTLFTGEITLSGGAMAAIDAIYQKYEEHPDSRFSHYSSRRQTHLLKLCTVMAAMERKLVLDESHVVWANTLLSSIEDRFSQAIGEFGKSKNSEVSSKIMNALHNSEIPLTAIDLWKVVQSDLENVQALTQLISGLHQAGKIVRGGAGFLPAKHLAKTLPFCDFSLLSKEERPLTKEDMQAAAQKHNLEDKIIEELGNAAGVSGSGSKVTPIGAAKKLPDSI